MISNTLPAFIKYKTCDNRPLRGGKGLSFDGVDGYIIDIPLNGYNFNKGFSFGLVCNIDKDAGNKRHILQYMTNGDYSLEIFGTTRGNKITARFEDSQNVATFFNASLANIQIIESIFCVYNYIDSTIKIYVNDILLVNDSYNFVTRNLGEALGKFAYFNINTVLGDVYFLRIGSQDLTFEQFLNKERLNEDLYCYNFEEENGLVVFDASGNDNHGVIFGNVNRISNDVYSRADEVGYSLPATTNLFNINGLIGNGPRTYYFNVLGNLQVVFPRPSVNVFMAIAFGKEYNLRIDSPRQITIKHGGYGAGTVTLGQTNQDLTFTSYTNGSYALLFLNNFTQEDFNNSTINLSLVEDFIIPRDESNTDFDVLGNELQFTGKACGANE